MELAKVTSKGQVTIPIEIRKNLVLRMEIKFCLWKRLEKFIYRILPWMHYVKHREHLQER